MEKKANPTANINLANTNPVSPEPGAGKHNTFQIDFIARRRQCNSLHILSAVTVMVAVMQLIREAVNAVTVMIAVIKKFWGINIAVIN